MALISNLSNPLHILFGLGRRLAELMILCKSVSMGLVDSSMILTAGLCFNLVVKFLSFSIGDPLFKFRYLLVCVLHVLGG